MNVTLAGQQFWLATDKDGRIIRGGIPAQHVAISRVDGSAVSKLGAKPDYSAPVGAPYFAEEVTVPTTLGHTLGGTFTKPVNATGKVAVVISITGSGAQNRDEFIGIVPKGYRPFRQIADTLGKLGIAMLRMDDRGYGIEYDTAMTVAKREATLEGGGKPRCHHARVSRAESALHPSAGRQSVGLRHTVVKSCSAGSGRHAHRLGEGSFDSDAVSPMRAE